MPVRYYGIAGVLKAARRIGPATERMVFVNNDEVLVGIVRGSKYAIAADLTDRREYAAFYGACQRGEWLDIELYRMPRDQALKCPDQGRMTVRDLDRLRSSPTGTRRKQQ